jgi:cellulose synthase/poly-beta-1,6-N-acetylglucosamine synthase-like glycosyltransferase
LFWLEQCLDVKQEANFIMKNASLPLISLVILFYNQEKYVRETLEAAFLQDYENLEIIISDDNSSDQTHSVIEEVIAEYKGKHQHKIKLNKNEQNLGLIEHVNKVCIQIAEGQFLVMNGGDDISLKTRCSDVYRIFCTEPEVKFIYGSYFLMSENGEVLQNFKWEESSSDNLMSDITNYQGFHGASCSYHRDVFDFYGPITHSLIEDRTLIFRAMLLGKWAMSKNFHVKYRLGGLTTRNLSSPKQIAKGHLQWALKHHFGAYKQLRIDVSNSPERFPIIKSELTIICNRMIHLLELLNVLNSNKCIQIYNLARIIGGAKYNSIPERKLIVFFVKFLIPDFATKTLRKLRVLLGI